MGILMECSDVNLVSGDHFGSSVGAMEARREYYPETLQTFTINTRETDFGSIVQPIPITVKTYSSAAHVRPVFPQQPLLNTGIFADTRPLVYSSTGHTANVIAPAASNTPSPIKESATLPPPPKKKWIKEYLEKEPCAEPGRALVGAMRTSPPPALPAPLAPVCFTSEHSRPRAIINSHRPPPSQIPSPPVGSNGSNSSNGCGGTRSGTREVHNKLEKNRRAHLKECFELLKRQLPNTTDDKKTSNLSILGTAIRHIQVLHRKEREFEHEMERLAREKISFQQRLAALRREIPPRVIRTKAKKAAMLNKDIEERINGQVIGIAMSSTPPVNMESQPRTLNLSTKLRTLPIQLTPTTSQVVQASYGSRHNTLTLTTLAPVEATPTTQLGVMETRRVVVGGLQLLAPPLLLTHPAHTHHHTINGVNTVVSSRTTKPNGVVSSPASSEGMTSVVVSPIVVSNPQHLLHHTLTHKVVERQVVKGGVSMSPYLNNGLVSNGLVNTGLVGNNLVSPVVVVSSSATPPSSSV